MVLDTCKEKQYVTQDTYFNTLMQLRNVIQLSRRGSLSQKIVLIHDNAHPHRVQLIQTLLRDFCWEQLEHSQYSLDLVLNDYYLFRRLKKELQGQRFQTQELISAIMNICTELVEDFYDEGIEMLVTRYSKYLDRYGNYEE